MRKTVKTIGLMTLAVAAVVTSNRALAGNAPLGLVIQAQDAVVDGVEVLGGTSLFNGDTISTHGKGFLRMRLGSTQLVLGQNSTMTVGHDERGMTARLTAGTARFSGGIGSPLELRVLDAVIRGRQESSAGQVAIISLNEFQVGATSGSLTVDVNGDLRTVDEATAYDATLSNSEDSQIPAAAGKRRSLILWMLIGLAAIGTAIAVAHATISASKLH